MGQHQPSPSSLGEAAPVLHVQDVLLGAQGGRARAAGTAGILNPLQDAVNVLQAILLRSQMTHITTRSNQQQNLLSLKASTISCRLPERQSNPNTMYCRYSEDKGEVCHKMDSQNHGPGRDSESALFQMFAGKWTAQTAPSLWDLSEQAH